ncbi:hypothetical protein QCA50_001606 [Cerrena zonata]|uniref:Uncharacterized protein n=1 Tax=Cerrena zonata TaxID=2478898 RepID=A0AAW0GXE0_9APHY
MPETNHDYEPKENSRNLMKQTKNNVQDIQCMISFTSLYYEVHGGLNFGTCSTVNLTSSSPEVNQKPYNKRRSAYSATNKYIETHLPLDVVYLKTPQVTPFSPFTSYNMVPIGGNMLVKYE